MFEYSQKSNLQINPVISSKSNVAYDRNRNGAFEFSAERSLSYDPHVIHRANLPPNYSFVTYDRRSIPPLQKHPFVVGKIILY